MVKSGIRLPGDTPAAQAFNRLDGSLPIVGVLMGGPKSFMGLRQETGAVPQKLKFVLLHMIGDGLIGRTSSGEYELTEKGRALRPIFRELGRWWDIWGR